MSCNSLIDVATTTSTSVLANGVNLLTQSSVDVAKKYNNHNGNHRNTQFVFLGNSKDLQ